MIWDLKKFSDNAAVISEDGTKTTYSQFAEMTDKLASAVGGRCLVMNFCKNEIGSLLGYVTFLNNNIVPIMVAADLERGLLHSLIELYQPDFLWLPNDVKDEFSQYACKYSDAGIRFKFASCVAETAMYLRSDTSYGSLMFATGLKPKDMRVGQLMQAGTAGQTEAFKALVREVILQGITGEVSELNLADPENLYLITTDKFTAHLGSANDLRAKIGTVRAVIAYLRGVGSDGGMLEADIPGEVVYSPLTP